MSAAARRFPPDVLGRLVMVTSTEPCPMCAGATFWTGVRAVVFGLPEEALCAMCTSAAVPNPPVLNLPSRQVFAASMGPETVVVGPVLEAAAREVHAGFWEAEEP
jgi:tRNA(Arg) A34 adenosine deaminase TadA